MSWWPHIAERVRDRLGGTRRARIIITLASVFALDGAAVGAVGSMARPLRHSMAMTRTELGLLLTVSLAAGAVLTIPLGALVDRMDRTRLLAGASVVWGVGIVAAGCAWSYGALLVAELVIGAATAVAAPGVASLIGDYFFTEERARIYGYVLGGELIGTGIGTAMSGLLATWSWRAGFFVLAPPALFLGWVLHRTPEPARGGGDRLRSAAAGDARGDEMRELVRSRHIEPRSKLLLDASQPRSTWSAIWYLLRIPTNLVLIIGSALGYFYFTGLRTFGVPYLHDRYDVSHSTSVVLMIAVGTCALVGVFTSGHLADRLLRKGHIRARVVVAAAGFALTLGLLVCAFSTRTMWLGLSLFALAGTSLAAMNPPLDSARLDIVVPRLRGRAEALRMLLRKTAEALGPVAFGVVAQHAFRSRDQALNRTFLVMAAVLALAGIIAAISIWTYARDVATAEENARR